MMVGVIHNSCLPTQIERQYGLQVPGLGRLLASALCTRRHRTLLTM